MPGRTLPGGWALPDWTAPGDAAEADPETCPPEAELVCFSVALIPFAPLLFLERMLPPLQEKPSPTRWITVDDMFAGSSNQLRIRLKPWTEGVKEKHKMWWFGRKTALGMVAWGLLFELA